MHVHGRGGWGCEGGWASAGRHNASSGTKDSHGPHVPTRRPVLLNDAPRPGGRTPAAASPKRCRPGSTQRAHAPLWAASRSNETTPTTQLEGGIHTPRPPQPELLFMPSPAEVVAADDHVLVHPMVDGMRDDRCGHGELDRRGVDHTDNVTGPGRLQEAEEGPAVPVLGVELDDLLVVVGAL
eukprot:scaffold35363_cov101-Isochrysis_galbana.AAC.2